MIFHPRGRENGPPPPQKPGNIWGERIEVREGECRGAGRRGAPARGRGRARPRAPTDARAALAAGWVLASEALAAALRAVSLLSEWAAILCVRAH